MINKKFTNGHSQLFTEAWVTCKLWLVGKFWVAFLLLIINLMAWWLTFEPRGWTSGVKSQLTFQHLWHYNRFNFINAKIPNSNLRWTFHYSSFSLKVKIYIFLLHGHKLDLHINNFFFWYQIDMAQGVIKCTPKPVYDILFLRRLHWNCSGFWIRLHIYTWTKIDGKTYQPRGLLACFSLQHALMYEPSLHRYQISDISPNSQWNSLIAIKLRFCYELALLKCPENFAMRKTSIILSF